LRNLEEDISNNTNNLSVYDPLLGFREKLRRRLGSIAVDNHNGSVVGGTDPNEYDEYQGVHDKA
jgi:hypothetical protein